MEFVRIGLIVRPHGVNGAVKLLPLTDDSKRFHAVHGAFLEFNGGHHSVEIYDIGVQKDAVFARISGYDNREDAEKLRNVYLCVDKANAVKLPKGRYFIDDLIGCDVFDDSGKAYGRLADVIQTGANDVYEIKGELVLLIPALKKLLKDVDIAQKRIVLHSDVLGEVGLFED